MHITKTNLSLSASLLLSLLDRTRPASLTSGYTYTFIHSPLRKRITMLDASSNKYRYQVQVPLRAFSTRAGIRSGQITSSHYLSPTPITYTYQLGRSLYIPLTSKCNSNTLPCTRGGIPFLKTLPKDVLRSLVLVRVAEHENSPPFTSLNVFKSDTLREDIDSTISSWLQNGQNNDYDDTDMVEKIRNILSSSLSLTETEMQLNGVDDTNDIIFDNDGFYPSIETLYHEIKYLFHNTKPSISTDKETSTTSQNLPIESIVFAGEGEPTLRLDAINSLSQLIRRTISKEVTIRVLTNGLQYYSTYYYQNKNNKTKNISEFHTIENTSRLNFESQVDILLRMKESGVDALSIALPTSCPEQYHQLMKPIKNFEVDCDAVNNNEFLTATPSAHDAVCQFVKHSLKNGFDVELTGVKHDSVDKKQTEQQAIDLGVNKAFRWRSFFF